MQKSEIAVLPFDCHLSLTEKLTVQNQLASSDNGDDLKGSEVLNRF
ncbi:hypothetical protein P0082_03185 [Candidatus Haliotispira prima]|uniref:Uncharacterized protein n=1 Tax=Candidatus Haliotispira prima TaxID=3034016 RepID=A0ABY8MIT0_9SPIO|nr:hypothetical protein P0082_03185 [Candidatus Haliotispira prima]